MCWWVSWGCSEIKCWHVSMDHVAWGWVPCQMARHRTSSEGMVYWRLMGGGGAQHDKPSLVVIVRSGPNNLDSLSCNCGNLPLHFSIDDINFYLISDTSTMFSGFWIVSVLFFLRHFLSAWCITTPLILNVRRSRLKNKIKFDHAKDDVICRDPIKLRMRRLHSCWFLEATMTTSPQLPQTAHCY